MVMEIPLTRGFVALVDDADYESVTAAGPWSARPRHRTVYAQRAALTPDGRPTTQQLHRFLTGWHLSDHKNGDGLDNRRENLRPATSSQNCANARLRIDSTTGYKGVTKVKGVERWHARIRVNKRVVSLGRFSKPEDAAAAYDAAAIDFFGEFALTNFPQEKSA